MPTLLLAVLLGGCLPTSTPNTKGYRTPPSTDIGDSDADTDADADTDTDTDTDADTDADTDTDTSATDTSSGLVHTGDTAPAHTGDTARLDTAPTYDPLCSGYGPGTLQIGEGGINDFAPWSDGSLAPLTFDAVASRYGLQLSMLTTGLDTTGFLNTVVRIRSAHDDSTFIGLRSVQCPNPGPGWLGIRMNFDEALQADIHAGGWDGDDARISVTVIDEHLDTASIEVDVVFSGP